MVGLTARPTCSWTRSQAEYTSSVSGEPTNYDVDVGRQVQAPRATAQRTIRKGRPPPRLRMPDSSRPRCGSAGPVVIVGIRRSGSTGLSSAAPDEPGPTDLPFGENSCVGGGGPPPGARSDGPDPSARQVGDAEFVALQRERRQETRLTVQVERQWGLCSRQLIITPFGDTQASSRGWSASRSPKPPAAHPGPLLPLSVGAPSQVHCRRPLHDRPGNGTAQRRVRANRMSRVTRRAPSMTMDLSAQNFSYRAPGDAWARRVLSVVPARPRPGDGESSKSGSCGLTWALASTPVPGNSEPGKIGDTSAVSSRSVHVAREELAVGVDTEHRKNDMQVVQECLHIGDLGLGRKAPALRDAGVQDPRWARVAFSTSRALRGSPSGPR